MEEALIVSSTDKSRLMLYEMLKNEYSHITSVTSGSEARRILISNSYDLVIINAPLIDEPGYELALKVAQNATSGVLLMVKAELEDEISARVEDHGVFVVAKPISKDFLYRTLKLVETSRRRMLGLKSENNTLHKKIEEIRVVNRAKCLLISYKQFTEAQAHKFIEKQAMDTRQTRIDVALKIVNHYGG